MALSIAGVRGFCVTRRWISFQDCKYAQSLEVGKMSEIALPGTYPFRIAQALRRSSIYKHASSSPVGCVSATYFTSPADLSRLSTGVRNGV